MKKIEIVPLTILRFFAASIIFIVHIRIFNELESDIDHSFLASLGNYGVSLFFILSGFILQYNYSDVAFNTKKSRWNFFVKRLIRIYPLHLIWLFFSIPLVYLGSQKEMLFNTETWIINLFLFQSWLPSFASFNVVSWALSDLIFFYFLTPFIFPYVKNISAQKIILLSGAVIVFLYILSISTWRNTEFVQYFCSKYFPLTRFFEFLLGVGIYKYYILQHSSSRSNKNSIVLILIGSILSIVAMKIGEKFPEYFPIWLFPLGCSIVIYGVAKFKCSVNLKLSSLILKHLGVASFSFYMIHDVILRYIKGVVAILDFSNPPIGIQLLSSFFVFCVIWGISFYFFKYVENPITSYLQSILKLNRK